jgi:hypothetical protein
MNLRDFVLDTQKKAGGGITVIEDDKVPQDMLVFVGEGKDSAKMTCPWHDTQWLGQHIAETMEFLYRRKRITVVAFGVNPLNTDKLNEALTVFCDPESETGPEPQENYDDDVT